VPHTRCHVPERTNFYTHVPRFTRFLHPQTSIWLWQHDNGAKLGSYTLNAVGSYKLYFYVVHCLIHKFYNPSHVWSGAPKIPWSNITISRLHSSFFKFSLKLCKKLFSNKTAYIVKITDTMHWYVPLLYSINWLLHVSAVACHHQGALDPSKLLEIQTEWVVYHIMCGYVACVPDCRGSVSQISA
jgi:hypothetical protein